MRVFFNFLKQLQCSEFHRSLSSTTEMSIKTFIFMDCETTGLPYAEHNKTKITELCLTAVQSDHIELGVFPRVQTKLNLCFNPRKLIHYESTNITGLSNDLLENQPEFSVETVAIIRDFLHLQEGKLCLVAHNGNKFDYPILRTHIEKTGIELTDLVCVDSLEAFKRFCRTEEEILPESMLVHLEVGGECFYTSLGEEGCSEAKKMKPTEMVTTSTKIVHMGEDLVKIQQVQRQNETTPEKQKIPPLMQMSKVRRKLNYNKPSFKLADVYKRLTTKEAVDCHRAENDVSILIECCATLGEKFVDWANQNAVDFCDIPMMVPGRKIGT